MSSTFTGITVEALIELHHESLLRFGGAAGLRDEGALRSALARPEQIAAYEPDRDLFHLAAAAAEAIARSHPFIDGNKRAAFLALGVSLALNGYRLDTSERDAFTVMTALSDRSLDLVRLAGWARDNSVAEDQ